MVAKQRDLLCLKGRALNAASDAAPSKPLAFLSWQLSECTSCSVWPQDKQLPVVRCPNTEGWRHVRKGRMHQMVIVMGHCMLWVSKEHSCNAAVIAYCSIEFASVFHVLEHYHSVQSLLLLVLLLGHLHSSPMRFSSPSAPIMNLTKHFVVFSSATSNSKVSSQVGSRPAGNVAALDVGSGTSQYTC